MSKRARSESLDTSLLTLLAKKQRLDSRRALPAPFFDLPLELRFKLWGLLRPEPADLLALLLTCVAFHVDASLLLEIPSKFRGPPRLHPDGDSLLAALWRIGIVTWIGVEHLSVRYEIRDAQKSLHFIMEHPQGYMKKSQGDTGTWLFNYYGAVIELYYVDTVLYILGVLCVPTIGDGATGYRMTCTVIAQRGQSLHDFIRFPHRSPASEEYRQSFCHMLTYLQSVAEKMELEK